MSYQRVYSELDLTTANREVLLEVIAQQQAAIAQLHRRIAALEGSLKPGDRPECRAINRFQAEGRQRRRRSQESHGPIALLASV